jgi:hypothetical protein
MQMTFILIVILILVLVSLKRPESKGGINKTNWHVHRSNMRDSFKRARGEYSDTECLKPDGSFDWHQWRDDQRNFWDSVRRENDERRRESNRRRER